MRIKRDGTHRALDTLEEHDKIEYIHIHTYTHTHMEG